jgi:hypothetical protein
MLMFDRNVARREILQAVRDMAKAYPSADYSFVRQEFGLLGWIKRICGNIMPTAQKC